MKMRAQGLFSTFLVILTHLNFCFSQGLDLDSLESILDKEMAKREFYDQKKKLKIQAYRTIFGNETKSDQQKTIKLFPLIEELDKYSFDSTLFYSEKALAMAEHINDKELISQGKLILAKVLTNAGRSKEAEDVLKEINVKNLNVDLHIRYTNTASKLYEDLYYYAISEANKKEYQRLYKVYKDSLISIIDSESDIFLSLKEKELLDDRRLEEALKINSLRLATSRMATQNYSLISFQRSLIFDLMKNINAQKENLMLSAISDIKASVKDNASLAALAVILYQEGKIESAYKYIQFAYQDAIIYNSRLRFLEISNSFSLITAAYQERSDTLTTKLQKYLFIISVLVLVLAITIILIYRQVRKLSDARKDLKDAFDKLNNINESLSSSNSKLEELNNDLSEANHVKEQYIANFLNIQSEYIDKIDKYQKLVRKMLVGRRFEELLNRVNSQKYIDTEVAEFYNTFDQAFLSIYPNFINKFNELLKEEGRIELKEGERLNTELRIFALIRLGIKDSSNIAKLLRYSVHTIYNYRVKIKNLSNVPRDEFEQCVEKIGTSNPTSS